MFTVSKGFSGPQVYNRQNRMTTPDLIPINHEHLTGPFHLHDCEKERKAMQYFMFSYYFCKASSPVDLHWKSAMVVFFLFFFSYGTTTATPFFQMIAANCGAAET